MRIISALLILLLTSCSSLPSQRGNFAQAQQLVDRTAAQYPDIVRLTIHAVPTGETESRIIACNIPEKVGKSSDPEDIEAMKTNQITVLLERDNLNVTAPIVDRIGKPIAATGITLAFTEGANDQALIEKAAAIARQLSSAIQESKSPLW
ncbi:MAG TPA: hypothetical protein VMX13_02105 [Sedimentisphaerales bacterium]|nr:hypothetical protein [Sedimentisphaerales bacterium]